MKTICAFCKVKDDADIIESFCRYHLKILDFLVIYDDDSSDSTPDIVRKLVQEGLSIELIQTSKGRPVTSGYKERSLQVDALFTHIFKKYDADWIFPMNVDEFLYCEDGQNPRLELEKLCESTEYRFYWRTSVYCQEPMDSTVFLPNYFREFRDPNLEFFTKTIFSREIVCNLGGKYAPGNHIIDIRDKKVRAKVAVVHHQSLRVAHFPIHSIRNALVKVVCVNLLVSQFKGLRPFHYNRIYNQIKSDGIPTQEYMRKFSLEYSLLPEQMGTHISTIEQFRGALKADFLQNDIKLLYTDYQNSNFLGPILSFFEFLLEDQKVRYGKQKILFGAGTYGKRAFDYYGDDLVYAFADTKKHGMQYLRKPVIDPCMLQNLSSEYEIIVCAVEHHSIMEFLNEIGAPDYKLFHQIEALI